ncbi:hypothetical protein RRG08_028397 [Elysia crispata]|uniref:Uncharacterized protein n=1 Tax=Elysia crispata TaxID=231223 RepID=A0AAE1CRQ8_9GAST|nr:hypothetical protein RRG08_028397 [Elysia crispata]
MMQHWHLVKRVATITWEADRSSQEKRLECGATALRNESYSKVPLFPSPAVLTRLLSNWIARRLPWATDVLIVYYTMARAFGTSAWHRHSHGQGSILVAAFL